ARPGRGNRHQYRQVPRPRPVRPGRADVVQVRGVRRRPGPRVTRPPAAQGARMLVPAVLLVTLTLTALALAARRKARATSPAAESARPEYLPKPHVFHTPSQPPPALEVAHASRSGALALNAGPS